MESAMKKSFLFYILIILLLFPTITGFSASDPFLNPLEPVKTDNPRDTMQTFMNAMEKYREGKEKKDPLLTGYIDRAVRCFDLSGFIFVEQQQRGREVAILLK